MLQLVPVPASTDKPAWESYRRFLVSAAMEPGEGNPSGMTPAQAGPVADAQARAVFAAKFPAVAYPISESAQPAQSHSDVPLPGAQRTADGRSWVVVSRPEDDRSAFPPEERIQADGLRRMAASYAPETIHRAPVVLPLDGPSHWTGEFADRVPGQIDGLAFDGYFLWALIRENQGGVTQAVENGLSNRSIRWWQSWPDAGDEPYLRHLAVTSEPAGTSNLGNLDNFFRTEQARRGRTEQDIRSLSAIPTRERSVPDLPTLERSFTMADPTKIDFNQALEQLRAAHEAVAPSTARTVASTEDVARAVAKEMATATTEAVRTAVDAAVKPLQAELAEIKTARVAGEKAARTEKARAAFDTAVRERRISPQERTTLEALVEHLPVEAFDKMLNEVAQRSAMPIDQAISKLTVEGADGKVRAIPDALIVPGAKSFRGSATEARAMVAGWEKAQEALRAGKSPAEVAELSRAALKEVLNVN